MVALVRDMQAQGYAEPVLVASNTPKAGGLSKAADLGVATAVVDHRDFKGDRQAFEIMMQNLIDDVCPDIICLAGFMRILGADFVEHFAGRMINVHPSILPKFKGLHTHQRALDAGEIEHGCTVHRVTPLLDDGPILGQAKVPVLSDDTADTLAARVLAQEHILYPAVLKRVATGVESPLFLP